MLATTFVTLFPEMFRGVTQTSILGRGISAGHLNIAYTCIRDFATDKHQSCDDTPYGEEAWQCCARHEEHADRESSGYEPKCPEGGSEVIDDG